jgi:SWI/SNF-related matrix-associated actin-dependent regulator 1 of chromatin subfamily A
VGWTLVASSNVGVIEYPWTPGDLRQAEDRCHRIGQKNTVNVWYLMVPGTIEEKIADILDKKTKVLDAVLDGVETNQDSLLKELMYALTK